MQFQAKQNAIAHQNFFGEVDLRKDRRGHLFIFSSFLLATILHLSTNSSPVNTPSLLLSLCLKEFLIDRS
jgi:hypothetical protein